MIKKLLITMLLAVNLFSLGICFSGSALAQGSTVGPASDSLGSTDFMFDLTQISSDKMKSSEKTNWVQKGINFLIERGIAIMVGTVGTAAVLVMVIGGFRMITGGASEEQYNHGKAMVKKALIGLVFVLMAYILVTSVQLLIQSIFK